ncbi:3-phosphoshikimate 1-carboxyvinyltransferase [Lignipirellula cremea]|uniref:3-phosphoshikimate 1-carboxyvinyltransferase n=2 Tax=Lignipirellula cremea TaxID=2528010 RepID=A0A518DTV1_9BACT|nr:3-phosphoshikimate 1-carboxyvinyltransferase [Lignipirellula cremea]
MSDRELIEPTGPLVATVRPPGSKSITNRALVCAALAEGRSTLRGALDSEDTQVMLESLRRLGVSVRHDPATAVIEVEGCGGQIPARQAELFVANSGTTIRFLTALVTLGHGTFRLDGVERMRERPIGDLVDTLVQLGARIECEAGTGCPPVLVQADGLPGGSATVAGNISSQYLSGMMMTAPCAAADVELNVSGELVSQPYVRMTSAVMASFGVQLTDEAGRRFLIPAPQRYQGRDYAIEPDASAASYFWAAAAITQGRITVTGLSLQALQGDVAFCQVLEQMGCLVEYEADQITVEGRPLHGVDVDMNAISDTVQTLTAVALYAEGPTVIRNVAHNRHKETDRIGDLACELRKLGALVEETEDGLRITPQPLRGASIETYHDHRMAMSMALVGLRTPGVEITNPGCVGKTYPQFFDDLRALTASAPK